MWYFDFCHHFHVLAQLVDPQRRGQRWAYRGCSFCPFSLAVPVIICPAPPTVQHSHWSSFTSHIDSLYFRTCEGDHHYTALHYTTLHRTALRYIRLRNEPCVANGQGKSGSPGQPPARVGGSASERPHPAPLRGRYDRPQSTL